MTSRAEWMSQLHAWFDYWLFGLQNGIMSEPRVDIENTKDNWGTYADWPLPGAQNVNVFLQGDTASTPGKLGGASGGATDTLAWTDLPNQSEATALNIAANTTQNNRRVFLSPVLKADLRLSGTPRIDLRASLDKPQSNIVGDARRLRPEHPDHALRRRHLDARERAQRLLGRVLDPRRPDGQVMDFDACYQQPTKPTVNDQRDPGLAHLARDPRLLQPRLAVRGRPVTPGAEYEFNFPILPVDYTIPAGHRLGVVLMANFSRSSATGRPARDHAQLAAEQGRRCRSSAATTGWSPRARWRPTRWRRSSPPPGEHRPDDADPTGAVVTFPLPAATDNEDPSPTVDCDHAPGSRFPVGPTLVTCTATDASGNTAKTTFTVLLRGAQPVGGTVPRRCH